MRGAKTNTDSREATIAREASNNAGQSFATATVLARRGRYNEAAKLVQKALDAGECSKAESLDLLARIYVQQGRHLDAEACWREAKHLDESNPVYDDALNRLRRGRLSSNRPVHIAAAFLAFVFLALSLWQVLFANPAIYSRQDAAEASLLTNRGDIAASRDASQKQRQELAASIADVNRILIDLDSRLTQQLKALATSADAAKQRDAVITHLDQQVATLQKALECEIGSQTERYERLNAAQIEEIEAIKASVADTGKALTAVEGSLGERIKEVERVGNAVLGDVESLPTADDLAALQKVVEGEVGSLGARYEKLNTAQIKEIEAIKASIADTGKALTAVESRLGERIKELEGVETAIRSDVLSTAADLTAIGRSVLVLQQQLGEISAAAGEDKDTADPQPTETDKEKSQDESVPQPEEEP